jgi:hypothetical protein
LLTTFSHNSRFSDTTESFSFIGSQWPRRKVSARWFWNGCGLLICSCGNSGSEINGNRPTRRFSGIRHGSSISNVSSITHSWNFMQAFYALADQVSAISLDSLELVLRVRVSLTCFL